MTLGVIIRANVREKLPFLQEKDGQLYHAIDESQRLVLSIVYDGSCCFYKIHYEDGGERIEIVDSLTISGHSPLIARHMENCVQHLWEMVLQHPDAADFLRRRLKSCSSKEQFIAKLFLVIKEQRLCRRSVLCLADVTPIAAKFGLTFRDVIAVCDKAKGIIEVVRLLT